MWWSVTVPEVNLRDADSEDMPAIADLFLACWRTSYRDVLPPHVIAMYGPASALDLWRRSFSAGSGDRRVVVAERADGSVLGVVTTGKDADDPAVGHVVSLYVHPAAQGRGIGARLISDAIDQFMADELTQASLWVFAANETARAFYMRLGWFPDGGTRVEPQYGEPELRLIRSLPTADGLP
jgi:ribosomal protein S18 acetylase RimI-like enzyme